LTAGLLYLGATGYAALVRSGSFEIQKVEIAGLERLSEEELRPLIGIRPFTNLPDVDLERLSERLLAHRWIREVQVRKTYPDRLTIRVKERRPVAIVEYEVGRVLVDETGRVLESAGREDRPVIRGVDPRKLERGDPDQEAAFGRAASFLRAVSARESELPRPLKIDPAAPDDLVLELNGYRVRMGDDNFSEKWERLRKLEPDMLKRKGRLHEVDLRFPGQVIVRGAKNAKGVR
jgi:cell division protein FtsQ